MALILFGYKIFGNDRGGRTGSGRSVLNGYSSGLGMPDLSRRGTDVTWRHTLYNAVLWLESILPSVLVELDWPDETHREKSRSPLKTTPANYLENSSPSAPGKRGAGISADCGQTGRAR